MNNDVKPGVSHLLEKAGIEGAFDLVQMKGGANNRVFQVEAEGGPFFLKAYFQHPSDTRNRLHAEFSFCELARAIGLRCVPKPLASDPETNLGLYEFIQGRRIEPAELTDSAIDQALQLFIRVNKSRSRPDAMQLPDASESCFSLDDHLWLVASRVARLRTIPSDTKLNREAAALTADRIVPLWEKILDRVRALKSDLPPAVSAELEDSERRISPSDFGFHNALLTGDGQFRFIDFEYAGWDDPAKMVCDFFCQVAVPVPWKFLPRFTEQATQDQEDPAPCRERIRLLLPVYQIKWCCIMLNDFMPTDSIRRRFSGVLTEPERKEQQLEKARALLDKIKIPE